MPAPTPSFSLFRRVISFGGRRENGIKSGAQKWRTDSLMSGCGGIKVNYCTGRDKLPRDIGPLSVLEGALFGEGIGQATASLGALHGAHNHSLFSVLFSLVPPSLDPEQRRRVKSPARVFVPHCPAMKYVTIPRHFPA